jgi:hypothetical protein
MTYSEATIIINIEIIDRDNIFLLYNNGETEKLTRDNNTAY